MYLFETELHLIYKKKSSSTHPRSANDDLLIVIPTLSRNCFNTFIEISPTEWNNLNIFKYEIETI